MEINYKIEAIKVLLDKDCVLERFYSLIPLKNYLVEYFNDINCLTKTDCVRLSDEDIIQSGLLKQDEVRKIKQFLSLYDVKDTKLKEIDSLSLTQEALASYKQLYMLPGVKSKRAALYFCSGFKSLSDIANATYEQIIQKITLTIQNESLNFVVPLPKEVRTHIAVSKVFTQYFVD